MKLKLTPIAIGILTAGLVGAQSAPATAAPQSVNETQSSSAHHRGAANWQDRMVQRMATRLNLTPVQQTQVRAILRESREHNKALSAKFRQERMALREAVKADAVAQIDHITQQNAQLNAQVTANHLKTMAKVYATLTPDQKIKFDQRFGHGPGADRAPKG